LAAVAGDSQITQGFIQLWDGQFPGSAVRKYTPPGVEYWRLYNIIGGYIRANGNSRFHMDGKNEPHPLTHYGYHGNKLVSTSFIFPHGYVPLDKDILKAYAIIDPAYEPDFPSLGTDWTGRRVRWHWHPWTTSHEDVYIHYDYEHGGIFDHLGDTIDVQAEHDSDDGDIS